jgi:hypothetical protein
MGVRDGVKSASFAAGGDASAASPWLRMFRNARRWVG